MKYYKKNNGNVFAFEPDGSQDSFITADMVEMTTSEVDAHVNPTPTPEQLQAELVANAQAALSVTDMVFIRCGKAGVAWPSDWQDYVVALRDVVNGTTSTMPVQPAYPAGS